MARTVRRKRGSDDTVRDGTPQHVSASCEHHGGCPWCQRAREIDKHRVMAAYRARIREWLAERAA